MRVKKEGHVLLRPFKCKAMHGNTWIRIKMEDQEGGGLKRRIRIKLKIRAIFDSDPLYTNTL